MCSTGKSSSHSPKRHLPSKSSLQLAPLASQHHLSEYNRLKFGPKGVGYCIKLWQGMFIDQAVQGCPMAYIPLTLCARQYLNELEARQAPYTPSYFETPPPQEESIDANIKLEVDLAEAMETPLTPPLPSSIKTSETHPIKYPSFLFHVLIVF